MSLELFIPIRTHSGNAGHGREHWAARAKRVKAERKAVAMMLGWRVARSFAFNTQPPITARLIRTKPKGNPLDFDNLTAALKSVRDQVAEQLGFDDGDTAHLYFEYGEARGPWGVRVVLTGPTLSLVKPKGEM